MSPCTIVTFAVLVAVLSGSSTAAIDKRIVNGVTATTGQYAYMASLQSIAGVHFCGGSIINSRLVLTAAHCINLLVPANVKIVVGTLTFATGGATYLVASFILHPSYVDATRIYDVGLVQTTTAITFSTTVKAVVLANLLPIASATIVVSGWGATVLAGPVSAQLKALNTTVISNADCTTQLAGQAVLQSTHFCTNKALSGACSFDDGDPVALGDMQFGIVSIPFCSQNLPDVLTSVPSAYNWIKSIANIYF